MEIKKIEKMEIKRDILLNTLAFQSSFSYLVSFHLFYQFSEECKRQKVKCVDKSLA